MARYAPTTSIQKLVDRVEALKEKMWDKGVADCVRVIKKMEALCPESGAITYYSGAYAAYFKFESGLAYKDADGETVTVVELKSYDDELLAHVEDQRLKRLLKLAEPIFAMDMWLNHEQRAPKLGRVTRDGGL